VGPGYRSSRTRRVGIRLLAWVVSRIVGQRVTDTTSGFQALNREGIALFARDYPHDYPEVEATVMVFRHRLRLTEVPVSMRERCALLWLLTGLTLTGLSAWREGLNTIAGWVGVRGYPPAVLFAVGILFILAVLLHYSTVISRLSDQNVLLAQRLALLEQEVR